MFLSKFAYDKIDIAHPKYLTISITISNRNVK